MSDEKMGSGEKDNPLRVEKRRKLGELRELGINPYPYSFSRTHSLDQVREEFDGIETGQNTEDKPSVRVAGRVMTNRSMGKAAFFHIQDQTSTLQAYIKIEKVSEMDAKSFKLLDLGDIVGLEGFVFRTKKGELSLNVQKFTILCKTIEPLPEKFHGMTDVELRYRYRHLDLIMNSEQRKVFETRSKIIREMRSFLDSRGFMEVETPILQPIYGGAAAEPFTTHHNTLDMPLYLRISPELYLKRLIVGGFEKVYDLNRNFRNEGIDRSHNPEFTMLEWYEAYTDYNYQMEQFEELVAHLAKEVTGSTKVMYQGKELDFTTPWKRLTMYDALGEYGEYSIKDMSDEEIFKELREQGSDLEKPISRGEMIAELFELVCEEHLWQPVFIIDHPVEISPLTKVHRSESELVERFEPFAAYMEIGNAYSELNDPEDQRARLKAQEAKRGSDAEAHPMDEDFVHAIEVGMPPTGGVGLGVERIVMMLTDSASIRDVIPFPTMKKKY